MKLTLALLLSFLIIGSFSGVIQLNTPQPSMPVTPIWNHFGFWPLAYESSVVKVNLESMKSGINGVAFQKLFVLYPAFRNYRINACQYIPYGSIRIYTFAASDQKGEQKQASTSIEADDADQEESKETETMEDFVAVNTIRAYEIPRISFAINVVVKSHWNIILGNPLMKCWQKATRGKYVYKFWFNNVNHHFEYDEVTKKIVKVDGQGKKEQTSSVQEKGFFADKEPMFSIVPGSKYTKSDLAAFKTLPGYHLIVDQLKINLGFFDDRWILDFSHSTDGGNQFFKFTINFYPFKLKQKYEAHYYGNVKKASLLKIDEEVFDGTGRSFEEWDKIEEFTKFKLFDEANDYVLSQFTWIRFYKVVSAYSAINKGGRYVRLIYEGLEKYVDKQNQINIVVLVTEEGKYCIDRNDFHATSLGSFGRNDWVSLFIETPDVTKAEFYQEIVKFFKSIYPKFWENNQLEDIKFKDDLHVIFFRNPTNEDRYRAILSIDKSKNVKVINQIGWRKMTDDSPLWDRIEKFIEAKYPVHKIMFIQYFNSTQGTYFEVSYITKDKKYAAVYLKYIEAEDIFSESTDIEFSAIAYGRTIYEVPLPTDVNASIKAHILKHQKNVVAIISITPIWRFSYGCVVLIGQVRWRLTIVWASGVWKVQTKDPVHDGYFVAKGYPSNSAASVTGFVSKLQARYFTKDFKYVLIETKSVGLMIYFRIVYSLGGHAYEAIVKYAYKAKNSQVLVNWRKCHYLRGLGDYGYGKVIGVNYGIDPSYMYGFTGVPVGLVPAIVSRPIDLNCYKWDKKVCMKCIGEFYPNNGRCVKFDRHCLNWNHKGLCIKCSPGFRAEPFTGQCIVSFGAL